MRIRYKVAIAAVSLGTAFGAGRYTVSETIKTVTKTVEVEKKVDKDVTVVKQKQRKHTTIVEEVKPDGEKKTTTDIVYENDIDKKKNDNTTTTTDKQTDSKSTIVKGDSPVTISALIGIDITGKRPAYGVSVTKPILGPLTIGLWGLSNASCGASIGLSF